ncbi:MAG: hypothetical protein JW839_06010 [Candidatus Lokiarchaeota archaeon]|nr:hypothetical protein [Candidatus Lokiarchaeota archaeon]
MLLELNPDLASWVKSILFEVFIVILLIGSIVLLLKARRSEVPAARKILQGYALFGFCFACTQIFFLLSSYDAFTNGSTPPTFMNNVWVVCAYTVTMASIVFIFRVVEHYILNQKPIFTVIALVSFIIDIFALILIFLGVSALPMQPKDIALSVQNVVAPVLGIAICALYGRVIKNSAGDIRKKATVTFIGVLFILVGIVFNTSLFTFPESLILFRNTITPSFHIIGVLLVFFSLRK